MTRTVTLRPAAAEDQEFLLALYASTREEELAPLGWDDSQKRAFVEMQFNAQTRCYPKGDNRIILWDNRAVGRILTDRREDSILLVDISLVPEYRNLGIGTSLIKELLREGAATGKQVGLHVFKFSPAVRLYERLGFSTVGDDSAYLEMVWLSNSQSSLNSGEIAYSQESKA